MREFCKDDPQINCGDEDDDWVTCKNSWCSIKESVLNKKISVSCEYRDILRVTDHKIKFGKIVRSYNIYILRESDFVFVKCRALDKSEWSGIVYGISGNATNPNSDHKEEQFNVLIYGFNTLSRNAFIRKLPSSYNFLVNELHGDVLEGYNIVGDRTPHALIPMLTGFTELELPETRKRMWTTNYLNVYPMIWKEYKKHGYVTAFNKDLPNDSTLAYRLNGFDEQPTDHYLRPYYIAQTSKLVKNKRWCMGHVPSHKVMMDYTMQFMQTYFLHPSFIFSLHGELTHMIGIADHDLSSWLKELQRSGVLKSTILILMSDHGNRFDAFRHTLQGKQEERLSFFSFVFPERFKGRHNEKYRNFKNNLKRLTTPFDVHATLEDILRLQSNNEIIKKPSNSRSISLFDEIPANRSCADAAIEPHWCACHVWNPFKGTNAEIVLRAANAVVNAINAHILQDNMCAELSLDVVNSAAQLSANDMNVLRFKGTIDLDGFASDLGLLNETQIAFNLYQLKITVNPSGGIYEASVKHELQSDKFIANLSDVSRVNKYGKEARCIMGRDPELRKFCYCI